MFGKHVSEAFKEQHSTAWKAANPGGKDIIQNLIHQYRVEPRWRKALQHLRDAGQIEGTPKDIGALIKEVQADLQEESAAEIAEALLKWAMPKIRRGVSSGVAEWYKGLLLERQFDGQSPGDNSSVVGGADSDRAVADPEPSDSVLA